jgi:RNA-binding motif X-linked protein 2
MMAKAKTIQKRNEQELARGIAGTSASWHQDYKTSAYIFIGGLDPGITEGDILAVFSQYGEIVDIDLIRSEQTGVSLGFCYLAYEDQRSTILAVDNLNGIELLGRTIVVDHKLNYYKKEKKQNSMCHESSSNLDAKNA